MTEQLIRQRLILILIKSWPNGENMNIDTLAQCSTDELLCILENSIPLGVDEDVV